MSVIPFIEQKRERLRRLELTLFMLIPGAMTIEIRRTGDVTYHCGDGPGMDPILRRLKMLRCP